MNIEEGCKVVCPKAFQTIDILLEIVVPGSVIWIGEQAITNRGGRTKLIVEENNEIYHSKDNCIIETKTNTLICGANKSIIPDYISTIGDSAFYGCNLLESVTIPINVICIEDNAFYWCYNLKTTNYTGTIDQWATIYFGSGANPINSSINLYINEELVEIAVINTETINANAFSGCESLKKVILGENVRTIENQVFSGCKSIDSLEFGSSVSHIGFLAFSYCSSISNLYIPKNVVFIGYEAFATGTKGDIYCEIEAESELWDKEWARVHAGSAIRYHNVVFGASSK